jgi:SAM-dependent methyltransferase
LLTRRPALFAPIAAVDRLVLRAFPEVAPLPPPHLRLRSGSYRLGLDQVEHRLISLPMWTHAFAAGWMTPESDVVELACGAGRFTTGLARYYWYGDAFRGTYLGVDIDPELVEWCRRAYPANFRFECVGGRSSVYRPHGEPAAPQIPASDASADFIFANSLFTHLLPEDFAGYLRETARVLRPGQVAMFTVFCLEVLQELDLLGTRWTLRHRSGEAFVESISHPEAAVAYERTWLKQAATDAGFSSIEIRPAAQSAMILTR